MPTRGPSCESQIADAFLKPIWHPKDDRSTGLKQEWISSPASYTIEKSRDATDKGYILRTGSSEASGVHLVRLGKYLFVDVGGWWDPVSEWDPFFADLPPIYPYPLLPVHEFGRITVSPNVLLVRMIERDTVAAMYDEHQLPLELLEPHRVLASRTEELRKFALERAEDLKVFPKNFALCRQNADCGLEVPLEKVKDDPRDVGAGYDLAIAYMHRDRFDDAWATWKQTPPPKPEIPGEPSWDFLRALVLAQSFIDWGHPESGMSVLKTGTANSPKDPIAWLALGAGYLHLNRPQDGMAAFRKITPMMFPISIRTASEDIAHRLYVSAYLQMGEFQRARAEAGKFAGTESDARDAENLRAFTYFAEGDYAAADAQLSKSKAYEYMSEEPLFWYLTLRHVGKSDAALDLLKKVEEKQLKILYASSDVLPTEIFEPQALARYFRGQMSDSEFIAQIQPPKGRVVVPELCVAYFVVGEKHLLDGDREKAREYFQKAVDTHAYGYGEWIVANARLKQLSK